MQIRLLAFALFAMASLVCAYVASAADTTRTTIGQELQVFPGDKFYAEGDLETVPIVELERPFESRMPGSMRIPFSFAIDTKILRFTERRGDWDYFAAPAGKARAWHGAVGSVLAEGDTVGIRINTKKNKTQWFVDNTIHNRNTGWRFATIWKRDVDPKKDVTIRIGGSQKVQTDGSRIRGLEYLGVRDNQIRIRYEEFGPQVRTEEFLFPITRETPMLIGVKGLRAEIHEVNGASARIKVLRGFQADDWATPAE